MSACIKRFPAAGLVALLMVAGGVILLVEMITHLAVKASEGSEMHIGVFFFDAKTWRPWAVAVGGIVVGLLLTRFVSRWVGAAWDSARAVARDKGLIA